MTFFQFKSNFDGQMGNSPGTLESTQIFVYINTFTLIITLVQVCLCCASSNQKLCFFRFIVSTFCQKKSRIRWPFNKNDLVSTLLQYQDGSSLSENYQIRLHN